MELVEQVEPRRVMRPRAAAEALDVSLSTVYELIHSKAIPSFRVGKSIRIPVAEFDQALEAMRRGTVHAASSGTR